MDIEEYKQTSKNFPKRCSAIVTSSGNGSGPRPTHTCQRVAKYNICDRLYCHMHAGEECLEYILLNKGKDSKH